MIPSTFNPHYFKGLVLNEAANVPGKLDLFAGAGAEQIYYLFDFDRTLTTSKHTGDNTTTWQILHELLPKEGQQVSDAIRDKYLALEEAGQMSIEDSHQFSALVLGLHASHGTNLRDIKRAAQQINLREGSRELFEACDAAHIPTVILSAGIRDIIELIIESNGIHPTMLLSVKLQFDDSDRVIGWDKDSMVLTANKNESVKQWVSHISSVRPFTVLVGDTLDDARMVEGSDTVLRIRVCDTKLASLDYAYRQRSFEAGYDIILDEDLSPLVKFTQWLATART